MTEENYSSVYRHLALLSVFGAGSSRLWEAVRSIGSVQGAYSSLFSGRDSGVFTADELRSAGRTHEDQLKSIISYCESHNIGILCYSDSRYPERLRNIFSPPVLLFCRGNTDILSEEILVAVVGSRHMSEYTERVTKEVCACLAGAGVPVVSGFAIGTDITAHLAAVRNGGRTAAVLGCGLDYDYPMANARYKDELLENGVFVSEYFPKTAASPINFIARNRILSGLSSCVAVMEASDRSGSLNTASYALSQGKDIWTLPPADILDKRYNGNKSLIYDGAMPIFYPDDILRAYFENNRHSSVDDRMTGITFRESDLEAAAPPEQKEKKKSARKKTPAEEKAPEEGPFIPEPELFGIDKLVFEELKKARRPVSADEIASALGLDVSEILTVITGLEIEGIVSTESGQTYYLSQEL